MDSLATHNWFESLANLSPGQVLLIVAVFTVIRLYLVQLPSGGSRSFTEILESLLIAIALVFLVIKPFVMQAFYIPSASMEPTLTGNDHASDRILVNKFEYRFGSPRRGDIVVFIPPDNALDPGQEEANGGPVNFIKRLIALPGDRLQIVSGRFIEDGVRLSHAELRTKLAAAGVFGPNAPFEASLQDDHHLKFVDNGLLADNKLITIPQIRKIFTLPTDAPITIVPGYTILNGKRLNEPFVAEDPDYDLKIVDGEPVKLDVGGQEAPERDGMPLSDEEYALALKHPVDPIPPGHYFMMGDNRNDSRDSTEWGPLDAKRVEGRAEVVFWPISDMKILHRW